MHFLGRSRKEKKLQELFYNGTLTTGPCVIVGQLTSVLTSDVDKMYEKKLHVMAPCLFTLIDDSIKLPIICYIVILVYNLICSVN